jgi:putative transposase
MPRPLRVCLPNLTYHVYSRCSEKRDMMESDYFKEVLLEIIRLAQEKYQFEMVSYTIMDNHFHFIIRTVEHGASISKIMQYVKATFAQRYNRIMNRTGPFWNERFKNTIIEESANPLFYLLWLLWYCAYNPVQKGMVDNPRNYRYGGIHFYLNEESRHGIRMTLHPFLLRLGERFEERLAHILHFEYLYLYRRAPFHF